MMETNDPALSVILPVYNGEEFLRAAIESVLAQEGVRPELIVVDGASTDGTGAIAAGFGDRLRYFRTERDNVSSAKNFGIAQARHALIAFMSGDDLWAAQKLEKQRRWLMAHPAAAGCVCRLRYFLHEGCRWPANFPERLRSGEPAGFICETLLCRREIFDRVGLFDEKFATAEDVDWYSRARDAGEEIAVVPEVLLHKRVHERNISLIMPGIQGDLIRALHGSIRRKSNG